MKCLYVDCETTGTIPDIHGLIQMAGALVVDGKMVEQFNLTARPFASDKIEEEALKVNNRSMSEIQSFPDAGKTYRLFTDILGRHIDKFDKKDKAHFVGYNADFDASFIRQFFVKNGDEYFGSWFWWPVLDVSKLAGIRLMHCRADLPNFKLMTVAEYLGVITKEDAEKNAHEAMFDIRITMRVMKALKAGMMPFTKE